MQYNYIKNSLDKFIINYNAFILLCNTCIVYIIIYNIFIYFEVFWNQILIRQDINLIINKLINLNFYTSTYLIIKRVKDAQF